MKRTMSKAEREAEAERIRAALPTVPSEQAKADFMAEEYENVRSVFRSEYLVDKDGNKVRDENGKCSKAVGVVCGHCRAKSFFPYAPLRGEYMNLIAAGGWGGTPQDDYGFFDERDNIILFSERLFHCPFCGRQSNVYAYARMKYQSTAVKSRYAQEIRNVLGHVVVIEWKLHKTIDREGEEFFSYEKTGATFQVDGRMFRAVGFEYWYMTKYEIAAWRINLGSFKEGIGGVAKRLTYWNREELAGTAEGNDGLLAYLQFGDANRHVFAERYLNLWTKAPCVENLAKTYPRYMQGLLSGDCYRESIYAKAQRMLDLGKTKPHEIIGLEKEEAKCIAETAPGPSFVCLYRLLRGKKSEIPERLMLLSESDAQGALTFLENEVVKATEPPLAKLINYYTKNKQARNFTTLRDYWSMVMAVEGHVDESVMFPKNLRAAHDRIMERYQASKNKAQNDAIKAHAQRMKKYVFTDPETGLCIRPASSVAQLINEGNKLHHCVASYAKTVAKGETTIFFIRRIDQQKVPFFTLEYKNGKVIQNRGDHNCARTPEVIAFETKWLNFIKKGFVTNGKRTAKAGA